MKREKYLKELKNHLLSLTTEEQNEAIQYYSDYFDEADDDEKVIAELGTPEELAKTIEEKFANVPVQTGKTTSEEENEEKDTTSSFDALYYSFNPEDVINISFNFGAAQVVMIKGSKISVETRGITSDSLHCYLSPEGNLSVTNEKKINLNFFSHDRKSRIIPRVLISIPEDFEVNRFKVNIGAGSFETKGSVIKYNDGNFEVGAGNLVLKQIYGGNANFRCGMGNLEYSGKIEGVSNIDCGMGAVKIETNGNVNDYSYDVKVGLGDFRFNDEKKSGVCQYVNEVRKNNHFSVNCGMGSVNIKIQ